MPIETHRPIENPSKTHRKPWKGIENRSKGTQLTCCAVFASVSRIFDLLVLLESYF